MVTGMRESLPQREDHAEPPLIRLQRCEAKPSVPSGQFRRLGIDREEDSASGRLLGARYPDGLRHQRRADSLALMVLVDAEPAQEVAAKLTVRQPSGCEYPFEVLINPQAQRAQREETDHAERLTGGHVNGGESSRLLRQCQSVQVLVDSRISSDADGHLVGGREELDDEPYQRT